MADPVTTLSDDNVGGRPAPSDVDPEAAPAQPASGVPDPMLASVLTRLVKRSYEVSERSGFHADDTLSGAIANHVPDPEPGQTDSDAYIAATEAGWAEVERQWDELQDARRLLLTVSELIEAFDALRAGEDWTPYYVLQPRPTRPGATDDDPLVPGDDDMLLFEWAGDGTFGDLPVGWGMHVPWNLGCSLIAGEDGEEWAARLKPDGALVELADTLIRVCDLVGTRVDDGLFASAVNAKERFNRTRPPKHGKRY